MENEKVLSKKEKFFGILMFVSDIITYILIMTWITVISLTFVKIGKTVENINEKMEMIQNDSIRTLIIKEQSADLIQFEALIDSIRTEK